MQSKNYTIFFILLYLWILVTNPQSRFPILGEIHFERIVMIVSWIVLLLTSKINIRFSSMTFLIIIFYLFLNISYFFSPYQNYHLSQHWIENYWKFIILYFLILFSINDINDIFYIFTGFVLILFIYQAHSWYDFMHGGAYVWQQGIKRIVGIWSEGIGAANYFGMISLFSLPFALFYYKTSKKGKMKKILIFYFIMTILSIIYSGTRGALLGFVFLILINMRQIKQINKFAIILILVPIITLGFTPDYLKHRYLNLITKVDYTMDEEVEKIQRTSALGRMIGFIDGWELAKKSPIFGYGPGSSPVARKKVNKKFQIDSESDLQLHNLYGQVLSETGFLGTILFFSIIILYFKQFRKIKDIIEDKSELYNYKLALQNSMLLMLFYGIASHTLYRYYWFMLFACHEAFIDIVSRGFKTELLNDKQSAEQSINTPLSDDLIRL